ncbi:MAG TPA: tyrosine-type recombinase/integrase [Kutzneria sp.]|nr:tyrosine-type recombinase/integrase [Kutzneria sp.]
MTLALVGEDKTARERLQEFLRIYASVNTRLAYATDLGIPLEWVPGYAPPDPNRRRGRKRAAPTGLEWLNWCAGNELRFADVKVEHVERWLDELTTAGYSDATRGRMLSAVSAFYAKYLLREGLAQQNPVSLVDRRAQHLNKPAGTPSTTKRWSFQACRALLMAAYLLKDQRRDGRRDRAMIEILIGTGVRADELVGVNLDDYRRAAPHDIGILRVHGKGGKDREVALAPPVADALEDYLRERTEPAVPALPGQVRAGVRPIFVTSTGKRVHTSHLQAVLTRLCKAFTESSSPETEFIATHLGPLRDSIHPHSARHSYATHAVERGVPPRQVQRDLGHAVLATTEGYLHDEDNVRNSAAHELAPALHRGWLTTTS